MKNLRPIIILAFLFLISSCKKDIPIPDEKAKELFGEWDWIYSYGGWGGITTPSSEGYTRSVKIEEKGVITFYKNDKKEAKEHFTISANSYSGYTLKFSSSKIAHLFFKRYNYYDGWMYNGNVNHDTLSLSPECNDCDAPMYVRRK